MELSKRPCVPGFVHRERPTKGDVGGFSIGTVCPACAADLKFYYEACPRGRQDLKRAIERAARTLQKVAARVYRKKKKQ